MYSLDVETDTVAEVGAVTREQVEAVVEAGGIPIAWQPIVSLETREVLGYEALARFASLEGEEELSPAAWFAAASSYGIRQRLELAAVRDACAGLADLPPAVFISLNVSPATVADPAFKDAIEGVAGDRLILEIAEDAVADASDDVQEALSSLRDAGVRIALDDTGSGLVSLRQLLDIRADIIKIDTDIVRGIDVDVTNQAIAFSLKSLAERTGAFSLAEGVETEEEAEMLAALEISAAQGYLFGRPTSAAELPPSHSGPASAGGAGESPSGGSRLRRRRSTPRRSPRRSRG